MYININTLKMSTLMNLQKELLFIECTTYRAFEEIIHKKKSNKNTLRKIPCS